MNLEMDKYVKIRGAQAQGARTVEELKEMTDIVVENEDELKEVEAVLKNACKCKGVSVEEVVAAVKNGADTIEKVAEATKATTVCGRCKGLVANIIENKR